jgi:hypothetical protein
MESSLRNGNDRLRKLRIRGGVLLALAGFSVYWVGAEPALLGLDRSPVTGFVQIITFLAGLAILCLGGTISFTALWNGTPKTIAADIGLRLIGTGYVMAVASGMADVFGFGGQLFPRSPTFGAWQEVGVLIAEAVIALGFLLYLPFRKLRSPE